MPDPDSSSSASWFVDGIHRPGANRIGIHRVAVAASVHFAIGQAVQSLVFKGNCLPQTPFPLASLQ
jgi:hypothetical protein